MILIALLPVTLAELYSYNFHGNIKCIAFNFFIGKIGCRGNTKVFDSNFSNPMYLQIYVCRIPNSVFLASS